MKWINNFRKFQKIKEAWTTPPTTAIEYIYQSPDTSKIDTISFEDALKLTKSKTENSLENLKMLERNKDHFVIFEDDYTGKVIHEKINLDFSDLVDIFDNYTQFNLESETKFRIYDSSTFDDFFEISKIEVKMKSDSIFLAFTQGDGYFIIYIDIDGKPSFCGVKSK
jgi:5S rRNA maturation endonuclease (ribonuclease M5)